MRTNSNEVLDLLKKRNAKIKKEFDTLKKRMTVRKAFEVLSPKYNLSESAIKLIVYPVARKKKGKK